jgi:23S rRNA (adenine2503-C2)-methyltransferase
MPVANKYELSDVLGACDYYFERTGRRITFEYSLVHGVNDREEDAQELIEILKHRNCHINLIPVNPIKEREFERPSRQAAENFKNKLEKAGVNATIRRELGSDIDGACGQLRRRHIQTNNEKKNKM